MPWQEGGDKNLAGSAAGQRDILHHRTSFLVYKLREIGWEGVTDGQLGISQQVVSDYIEHHSFFLAFISLFFLISFLLLLMLLHSCSFVIVALATIISIFVWFIIILYSVSSIKLFLSQPLSFSFLLILIFLPIPLVRAAGSEWLQGRESQTGVKK